MDVPSCEIGRRSTCALEISAARRSIWNVDRVRRRRSARIGTAGWLPRRSPAWPSGCRRVDSTVCGANTLHHPKCHERQDSGRESHKARAGLLGGSRFRPHHSASAQQNTDYTNGHDDPHGRAEVESTNDNETVKEGNERKPDIVNVLIVPAGILATQVLQSAPPAPTRVDRKRNQGRIENADRRCETGPVDDDHGDEEDYHQAKRHDIEADDEWYARGRVCGPVSILRGEGPLPGLAAPVAIGVVVSTVRARRRCRGVRSAVSRHYSSRRRAPT